jgi:hypothetical protein
MMTTREPKTSQKSHPESMTISEHLAELPAEMIAGAERLRETPPSVRAYATVQPVVKLQTASVAAFAALLSRYGLRADLEATDGELYVRLSRREDAQVAR